MNRYDSSGSGPATNARTLIRAALVIVLLTTLIVAAGIALVAALGRQGDPATWARWSNIGQTFEAVNSVVSAVAVAGVLITWAFHSQQMQVAHLALQRNIDAEVRNQHVSLTQMAINDACLAEVWPSLGNGDPASRRQHMYANLLIQHIWLQYTVGIATRGEMESNLRFLFASPTVRAFWRESINSRQSIYVDGGAELGLAAAANEIWAEYEAVLACSTETKRRPPGTREWGGENVRDGETAV